MLPKQISTGAYLNPCGQSSAGCSGGWIRGNSARLPWHSRRLAVAVGLWLIYYAQLRTTVDRKLANGVVVMVVAQILAAS